MQRARAKLFASEFVATPGIQIKLNCIAIPDLTVWAEMSGVLIQAAQADVEVLLVPKEQELATSVSEIRVRNMDWRNKGSFPIGQLAVECHRPLHLRNKADDGLFLCDAGK